MTALIVILAIVFVIFLILWTPVGIVVKWQDGFFISLKIWFVKIRLLPKKEKKIKLKDYSKKNFERMLERERRVDEKRNTRKVKKTSVDSDRSKDASSKDNSELMGVIYKMRNTVWKIVKAFGGKLRTDVVSASIIIGAEDAAKCAILYGAVSQFCAYILEFLNRSTKMRAKKEAVSVLADFNRPKTEVDVEFHFSAHLIHALVSVIKFGFAYFDFAENDNK